MSDAAGGRRLREDPGSGRGWGATLLRLLVAVVVLGAAYVFAAFYFQDRPPAGVRVAGVDIGTLSREEAEAKLARELADRTTDPLTVAVSPEGAADGQDAEQLQLVPEEAGLSLDLDATLDGVTELSFDPRVLWAHVAGTSRDVPLVGAVDRAALEEGLGALAQDYDTAPVEGEVSLTQDGLQVVDSQAGRQLDVGATATAVEQAWTEQVWDDEQPAPREREVAGSATTVAPQLTAAEIERFTTEELEPALADPVRVTASRGEGEDEQTATAELGERDLLGLLSVTTGADHRLGLELDDEATLERVRQDLGQLEAGPRDATVELADGEVEVVPARVGYALEDEGLADAVRTALTGTGEARQVEVEVTEVEPQIPTAAADEWVFEPMSTFVSAFPTGPSDQARTANLSAGVGHVNGTVVMPGEQFSLGEALGEISVDAGYVEAPVINDGRLVKGLGGGLSQVSTVVFNASWFAGVQLDAHTPHQFYISRYPAGREATISIPAIDNLWTNDTDNPIVVQSWIQGDEIHMTFLGDRQYDVETIDSGRWDITTGEARQDDSPTCVPQSAAEGFTISNVRILLQDGVEVKRDEFTTVYQPSDRVTCTNPQAQGR